MSDILKYFKSMQDNLPSKVNYIQKFELQVKIALEK